MGHGLCGDADNMQAGVADIPFFGTIAKAFQFLFVQRVGTGDPAVEGNKARVGSTQAIHARAADPRSGPTALHSLMTETL